MKTRSTNRVFRLKKLFTPFPASITNTNPTPRT